LLFKNRNEFKTITEVVVEIALLLVAGHSIGVLVKTSDIFCVGITDIIVRSRSLG
jgi:hypothetical protein